MGKHYDQYSSFCQWILAHAENDKKLEHALSKKDGIDVIILINGEDVGLDFEDTMGEIDSQMNDLIFKEARQMLSNNLSDIIESLLTIKEKVEDLEKII